MKILLSKLFIWSRKTHRIFLFAASFLVIIMGTTGLFLKYYFLGRLLGVDSGLMRIVHNQVSPYIGFVLGVMMVSGVYMYIYPSLIKYFNKKIINNENSIQE